VGSGFVGAKEKKRKRVRFGRKCVDLFRFVYNRVFGSSRSTSPYSTPQSSLSFTWLTVGLDLPSDLPFLHTARKCPVAPQLVYVLSSAGHLPYRCS
jgi:hypothetical protein